MSVAVLFDNFGPYHLARLTAANSACETVGVECSSRSHEYAWQGDGSRRSFRSIALFTDRDGSHPSASKLRSRLNEVLDEVAPTAVAIPGWSSRMAFAAVNWCRRSQVPAILMSESTADDSPRAKWKEWIKKRYVGMCDAALVGGDRHRDYLTRLGMPADRIFFGYDAVDNNYFAHGAQEARECAARDRAALQLPDDYFLASARFTDKKNLPGLLRAYARYRELYRENQTGCEQEPWELVLLGDGPGRPQLQKIRDELGLSETVHFSGFQQYDVLPSYFGLARAFVHASTVEQWGLVVNEAMASGLPIILSNRCGCASTLLEESMNGYLFDPHQPEALAASMLRMAELSESDRNAMGQRSREIIANFGLDRFATGLSQAFHLSLERPKRHRLAADSLLLRAMSLKSL